MSHPHHHHRGHKVERERVHHITGVHEGHKPVHRARGGHVSHDDEAEDRALIRKEVKAEALKHDGKKAKHRSDKAPRRARGGKVHHGKGHSKTNVNVIVAPGAGKGAAGPMAGLGAAPMPPGGGMPPMPPKPPMAPPPPPAMAGPGGPSGPGGAGGMPPMPMRKRGGAVHVKPVHMGGKKNNTFGAANMNKLSTRNGDVYGDSKMHRAKGGAVGKKSAADIRGKTGIGTRTPIQHSGNKSDTQNIGRGPVITKATGGPVYSNGKMGKQMAPNLGAGAGSGVGKLKKNHLARAEHWEA